MSKVTERLLQVASVLAIAWFSWLFISNTVLHILRLQNQIAQYEKILSEKK